MARKSAGVTFKPHRAGWQFYIPVKGMRPLRPTLAIEPTPGNRAVCERLARTINMELELGVFDLAKHFKEYAAKAERAGHVTGQSLGHFASVWLTEGAKVLKPSTLREYRLRAAWWLEKLGRDTSVNTLTAQRIAQVQLTGIDATKRNLRNVLRGMLSLAGLEKLVPTKKRSLFQTGEAQKEPPDPFTEAERDRILQWLYSGDAISQEWGDYVQLAFYSGLRPNEQNALRWDRDIDWAAGELVITRSISAEQEMASTKTKKMRRVWLHPKALEALKNQRARTQFAPHGYVWQVPRDERPIRNQDALENLWRRMLRATKIRRRKPYATRATCASLWLMLGANPEYVAAQLGHSTEVLRNHYGVWIKGSKERDRAEQAKILSGDSRTTSSTKAGNSLF